MTTWSDDFSGATTGVGVPTGWSAWGEGGAPSIEVIADAGAEGGKYVQFTNIGAAVEMMWLTAVGNVTDVEVLAKMRTSDLTTVNIQGGHTFLRSAAAGTDTTYTATRLEDVNGGLRTFYGMPADDFTAMSTNTAKAPASTEWWWVRHQVIGDTVKARYWKNGDAEPGTWDITNDMAADANHPDAAGKAGVGGRECGTALLDFDFVSFSDNPSAESAPSPSTGGPHGKIINLDGQVVRVVS